MGFMADSERDLQSTTRTRQGDPGCEGSQHPPNYFLPYPEGEADGASQIISSLPPSDVHQQIVKNTGAGQRHVAVYLICQDISVEPRRTKSPRVYDIYTFVYVSSISTSSMVYTLKICISS